MSSHRRACINHHKQLDIFHGPRDNNIPHYSKAVSFKNFHACRLYNRWTKGHVKEIYSNRLGISYNTKYYTYPINNVAKKGLKSIYNKFYFNFQDRKSKSPNKFVAPEDCYYNFPIPHLRHDLDATVRQSEKESVATPPVLLTTIDLSSGSSQEDIEPIPAHLILLIPEKPTYEGGYLNQPSKGRIKRKNLQPLKRG
ncbi:uncharacterized protein OCT59_011744 [Rhizophagus irregularis]|uniref:uncharacterized protein n=1 Tax=Rhizophagus irregularis TaxID=588596 RepID=UPI0033252D21|nr:hypothetical protein OCT59_011744 [Rhizophagus irregularis]